MRRHPVKPLFRILVAGTMLWSSSPALGAGYDEDTIDNMGLAELLDVNLDVMFGRLTPREAPNIVTVITEQEIASSGARDLIDVLRLVPGIDFGVDVNGVTDIGVRGNWAHEGKVLVLLDGIPMNEIIYGTNAFGNHYPVDQIKQIEVIRGPGSAVYGGWAELAVISIKTKGAGDIDGVSTALTYGRMEDGGSRSNLSLSFGKSSGDLDVVAHVFAGRADRSDQDYTSYYGTVYNFRDAQVLSPYMVNLDMKYRGLDVRMLTDEYRTTQRDFWGPALERPLRCDFNTRVLDVKYDIKAADDLLITPRLTRKEGTAWRRDGRGAEAIGVEGDSLPHDVRFQTAYWRYTEEATASYDASDRLNIIAGVQAYQEETEYLNKTVAPELGGGYTIRFNNYALYAQGTLESLIGNITVGGRYEDHSQVGSSFVPRVGLTKIFDRFHFKALYAQAFKAPGSDTINLNPSIDPETSAFAELEAGYKLTDDMFVTANAYDINIDDTIIYYADDLIETQLNAGRTGTRGVELEYKYLKDWGFLDLTYSYSRVNDNQVSYYEVPGRDDVLLGLPMNKLTFNGQYRAGKFSIGPSLVWFSERYGYVGDGQGVKKFDPALLVNLFVSYSPVRNLKIGLGVYDILDQKPVFIQPYNGNHSPIPGPSREIVAKVSYDRRF